MEDGGWRITKDRNKIGGFWGRQDRGGVEQLRGDPALGSPHLHSVWSFLRPPLQPKGSIPSVLQRRNRVILGRIELVEHLEGGHDLIPVPFGQRHFA